MSTVIKDYVLHRNAEGLTYHSSVQIGDIIPLVVDFNDENVIGRAKIKWNDDETELIGELYIDKAVPFLCDPPFALLGTKDTDVFTSEEDGITYAVNGEMSQVSILTETGRDDFYERSNSQEIKEE